MKDIANSILKDKNLDINLPKFGQEMMSLYYRYSAVRLCMNYYTYNEMLRERQTDDGSNGIVELRKLMRSYLIVVETGVMNQVVGPELEEAVSSINAIRNSIIQVMKGLTSLHVVPRLRVYVHGIGTGLGDKK